MIWPCVRTTQERVAELRYHLASPYLRWDRKPVSGWWICRITPLSTPASSESLWQTFRLSLRWKVEEWIHYRNNTLFNFIFKHLSFCLWDEIFQGTGDRHISTLSIRELTLYWTLMIRLVSTFQHIALVIKIALLILAISRNIIYKCKYNYFCVSVCLTVILFERDSRETSHTVMLNNTFYWFGSNCFF